MKKNDLIPELFKLFNMLRRYTERQDKALIENLFGKNKVTTVDVGFLMFLLANSEREVYQKDIEEHMGLTAPTISSKLRVLEKNEMVARVYSKVDTRLKQVCLTEKGKHIAETVQTDNMKLSQRIDLALTQEEQQQLLYLVGKLHDAVKKENL